MYKNYKFVLFEFISKLFSLNRPKLEVLQIQGEEDDGKNVI